MSRSRKNNSRARWSARQQEAIERNKNWESLTFAEQLVDLDRRLGKDLGAVKQRKKIAVAMLKVATETKNKTEVKTTKKSEKGKKNG